jgi:hypothetical protein
MDYIGRQKLGGLHYTFFILKQITVLAPESYQRSAAWWQANYPPQEWLFRRVLELTYTAWDLQQFALDCGFTGPPFRWDEERRFLLRCELDAAFFHLYLPAEKDGSWRLATKADGCPYEETPEQLAELNHYFPTPRHAVSYIMDTFPIVRRKDEERYNGDYRTKRVILEIYDDMQESIRTGISLRNAAETTSSRPAVLSSTERRGCFIGEPMVRDKLGKWKALSFITKLSRF